jgi:hypothetical protein
MLLVSTGSAVIAEHRLFAEGLDSSLVVLLLRILALLVTPLRLAAVAEARVYRV